MQHASLEHPYAIGIDRRSSAICRVIIFFDFFERKSHRISLALTTALNVLHPSVRSPCLFAVRCPQCIQYYLWFGPVSHGRKEQPICLYKQEKKKFMSLSDWSVQLSQTKDSQNFINWSVQILSQTRWFLNCLGCLT